MRAAVSALVVGAMFTASAEAADLQPRTVTAFDHYVRVAEEQMPLDPFLRIDALPDADRKAANERVRRGEVYVERVQTREAGKNIDIPGGLVHHWVGAAFVPGATVERAVQMMQDYDHHSEIFSPNVARSKLLSRDGDVFRVNLRFMMKKMVTVVIDTENEARFTRVAPDRAQSRIYSLRVAEIEDAGTPQEHEKPVGHDSGYLWRLHSYWRFLEKDGGTYVQCEAITLTRGVPMGFGWLINPFVSSIPKDSLAFTLENARKGLTRGPRANTAP